MNDNDISRGKRKDTGEWVMGCLICNRLLSGGAAYSIIPLTKQGYCQFNEDGEYIERDIQIGTKGRCTGLRDKNGTLVFEGDIVRIGCKGTIDICAVNWERGGWRVFGDFLDADPLYDFINIEVEVIGNRWDNPELLQKKVTT